jgi:hypothetical protein
MPEQPDRPAPPLKDRVRAGSYLGAGRSPSILLGRGSEVWTRFAGNNDVPTAEPLVSLPGYASEIQLNSGVKLTLRGLIPELHHHPIMSYLLESAVTLHKSPAGFDLDLSFDRGRIYISNEKREGPAKVRLRILDEVWDITLEEPGAEVGVDLMKSYTRDLNWYDEEPQAEAYFMVLAGKVTLKVDAFVYNGLSAPPGVCFFRWDNKGPRSGGPQKIGEKVPDLWSKGPPGNPEAKKAVDAASVALGELSTLMIDKKKAPVTILSEVVSGPERTPEQRALAILALGALDEPGRLLDVLKSEDPARERERDLAVFALRRWVNRGLEQGRTLYDPKADKGLLRERGLGPKEAKAVVLLLHDFPDEARRAPETFSLLIGHLENPNRVEIRQLAYWQLVRLAYPVQAPAFNAAWPPEPRQAAVAEFRKLVAEGKLPPKPMNPPGRPGGM